MDQQLIGQFEARRISRMLSKLYLGRLRQDEQIAVSALVADGWTEVCFELQGGERTYRAEARLNGAKQGLRPNDCKDMLVDLLGHLFDGYLSEPREPFTGPKWEELQYEGYVVFMRGQERAQQIEVLAAQLLHDDARQRSRRATWSPNPHDDDQSD